MKPKLSTCDNEFILHKYDDGKFHIGRMNSRMVTDELFCCEECFDALKAIIRKAEKYRKKGAHK